MAEAEVHVGHEKAHLGHHFEDLEQQYDANILGMWLFLVTEIMLFGGLFAAYITYRALYPDVFLEASPHQNVIIGTVNTAVLIGSSLAMALAVHSAQVSSRRSLVLFLGITILLGTVFLGFKGVEYYEHYLEGLVPGLAFTNPEFQDRRAQIFFVLYFVMTGLHALHMVIGIVLIAIIMFFAWRGRFLGESFLPVELMGLYWHFVDIVWVFLFPLLYLLGRN